MLRVGIDACSIRRGIALVSVLRFAASVDGGVIITIKYAGLAKPDLPISDVNSFTLKAVPFVREGLVKIFVTDPRISISILSFCFLYKRFCYLPS